MSHQIPESLTPAEYNELYPRYLASECADLQDVVDSAKYSDFYREDDMINVIHEYLDLCRDNMDDDEIESTAAFIKNYNA